MVNMTNNVTAKAGEGTALKVVGLVEQDASGGEDGDVAEI